MAFPLIISIVSSYGAGYERRQVCIDANKILRIQAVDIASVGPCLEIATRPSKYNQDGYVFYVNMTLRELKVKIAEAKAEMDVLVNEARARLAKQNEEAKEWEKA